MAREGEKWNEGEKDIKKRKEQEEEEAGTEEAVDALEWIDGSRVCVCKNREMVCL